eukprot:scaffold1390_cov138-Cylindrotheca_fusiformis.AAC.39
MDIEKLHNDGFWSCSEPTISILGRTMTAYTWHCHNYLEQSKIHGSAASSFSKRYLVATSYSRQTHVSILFFQQQQQQKVVVVKGYGGVVILQ